MKKGRSFLQYFKNIEDIINDKTIFPAHICIIDGTYCVQTVEEHLKNTAEYARESLTALNLRNTAYLCGLLHDIGKLTSHYKSYLIKSINGEASYRGEVNHTFAGVRYILDEFHGSENFFVRFAAELIAYAVGAHHGEFDCIAPDGDSGFKHRLSKNKSNETEIDIKEALEHFSNSEVRIEINSLIKYAASEIEQFVCRGKNFNDFYAGLLARLLLSAVIEGDRRDTAEFMGNLPKCRYFADFINVLSQTEAYISTFPQENNIQKCRRKISDLCAEYADRYQNTDGVIFRLDLPTGGGKTLSSLRYALHRAVKSRKKHIIYVIPLLSILEQNADEIRKAIGDDDIVFEHHSNVVSPTDGDELQRNELIAETWDAPILVTTLVQFLNTLFSHKTTSIRRFHSLANSVIILDEVQTVPLKMVSLFNSAIEFLAKYCGADIILCSATQPTFEKTQKKITEPINTIIPYDEVLCRPFKRTKFKYYEIMDNDSIASFASEILEEKNSLLIVCNTKAVAGKLYNALQYCEADIYYLSTNLCMAHRRDIMAKMRKSLEDKRRKTLCISTQVIEAGVDISFEHVIRLLAGLDSLVQSAGRCNRHGENPELGEVSVIRCSDESLKMLPDIERGQNAVLKILGSSYSCDNLDSAEFIEKYYKNLYCGLPENFQDYYIKNCDNTIYSMLSGNQKFMRRDSDYCLNQAFLTAGKNFEVFDTESEDIVVPYGNGADIIAKLYSEKAEYDIAYQKELVESIKPYTVSIFPYQKKKLLDAGALNQSPLGVLTLSPDWYGDKGLLTEEKNTLLEV